MLTDIFANRYSVKLWEQFTQAEQRLIIQGFRILAEQLRPYYRDEKENPTGKAFWIDIQSRLSMELGLESLSRPAYSYKSDSGGLASHRNVDG